VTKYFTIFTLVLLLSPVLIRAQEQCTYIVSDVASLLNIQNLIRGEVAEGLSRNIVVCLNGGTYYLSSPLQFDNRDSGTGQYSITYQSTPGQTAVISGGKIITTAWTKSENIWTNTLSDGVSFRQLYLNNAPLPRASRSFTIESVNGRQITVNEIANFSNLSPDAELLALGSFSIYREKIIAGNSNTLTAATLMGLWSVNPDPGYAGIAPMPGRPLFVENDPKYLDQPGEWTLTTSSKTLKYFPKSEAEDPNSGQFIYPYLDQLLIISSSKNLAFNNLTFVHSKWTLPTGGYDGLQAGSYGMDPYTTTYFSPPAILTEFSSNLEFNTNTFWHLGSHGLALGQGSNNIKINGNLFTDIGGNSIMVGYRPQFVLEADWNPVSLAPQHNDITNNTIYSTATNMWDSVGIFAAFSGFTTISNNLIHDLPYSGISAGFIWNTAATSMKNTTIQYNLIYHTNLKLNDGGGIYVLGNQANSFMYNNAMTDIYPPAYGSAVAGIYFDNGSIGWTVRENGTNNWWCSDCPGNDPANSPTNFSLISNYVGDNPSTKYYISPASQVRTESGSVVTTDSNCYNFLANGDYYFPNPNTGGNRPCQSTANALSNYFLLQGIADDNRLEQSERWIYGYQPRSDWAPFGPQITSPSPTPTPTPTPSPTPTPTPPSATNFVFVFTGESNSGGQAPNSDATPEDLAPAPQVQILNNTTFKFENLDIGTNNNIGHYNLPCCDTHGLELQLANSTKANAFANNPQVYLVKTGQGLSTLSEWNVGGTYWTKFLQRTDATKALLPTPKQWVVWYSLGINDYIFETPISTFKSLTIAHLNKIKAELPGAIIIMTQFQSMGDIYTAALTQIAASEPNVYVVDSTGATLGIPLHWDYAGFKTLGTRMVTITNNALGSPTPTPTPTPIPFPGDLDGDNKVDIFDYNTLVASFGHPYTIFDYNQLVANFGKSN